MIINSNEKCPVCDRNFTDEDDIVICPHCATPHHRECYKALGHCFNQDKHSEGFDYTAAKTDKADNTVNVDTQYYQPPVEENDKSVCSQCGAEISKDAPFCSQCGARQNDAQYKEYSPLNDFGFNNAEQQRYEGDTQTIDGRSIADAAAVVRTNTDRFIPKFLKNKKISWNWSAFIFGPYYLLYRKMYKQGIVFLALSLITSFVISGLFAEEIVSFFLFAGANMSTLYTNPTPELINQFMEFLPVLLITIGVNLILRLIIAVFADSFYKAKILEVLDKVDRNLEAGGSFSSSMPMMEESSLSQADMKRLYLGKLGGTSILAPIIAYLALDLITSIVSQL